MHGLWVSGLGWLFLGKLQKHELLGGVLTSLFGSCGGLCRDFKDPVPSQSSRQSQGGGLGSHYEGPRALGSAKLSGSGRHFQVAIRAQLPPVDGHYPPTSTFEADSPGLFPKLGALLGYRFKP